MKKFHEKVILFSAIFFAFLLIFYSIPTSLAANAKENKRKIEIEYFNQKKEMQPTLQKIINNFEKQNPDIHVQMSNVPDAGTVLKTRMLSGDVPDVINIYPQNIDFQEWAKAGYFENLTHKKFVNNIKNNYASKFAVNGRIYNVPLTSNVYGFFYNATMFKKLGLKVPETWKQFEKLKRQIINKGYTPFAIAGSEPWTLNGYHQLSLATITGGFQQANNLLRFSPVNYLKVTNPYLKKDFERLNLLRGAKTLQPNWQGAAYNDAMTTFAQGKALITPNGSWALPVIQAQKPNFTIRTFPFPSDHVGKSLTVGSGDLALSVSSKSRHKAAANKFVAYMASKKAMQIYYDVDGSPSSVKGVVQKGNNSELGGLSSLAFTNRQIVWLAQDWQSENDFFNLTGSYLMTGNRKEMVNDLNTFFNPMKADNTKRNKK